ncbi:MAG: ABC transporter substrate-binding protein [Anaerolineae bacterium]|nr:ABC transporter substrate-binding protein [Anaerolineae bacterium]
MVIFGVIWLGSQRQSSVTVGLVTWAKSGTVVGSSELHAGKLFLEEHPDSPVELVVLDDEWDRDKTVAVIEEAMKDGMQFFIASHPSKCTVASMSLFEEPNVLMINTASTSPALTGQDDYILRIVADAEQEQRAIAQYIHSLPGNRILVLQDTSNLPYTDPAFATFSAELEKLSEWHIVQHKLLVSDFDPGELETLMAMSLRISILLRIWKRSYSEICLP